MPTLRVRANEQPGESADATVTGVFADDDEARGKYKRLRPGDDGGWTAGLGDRERFDAERARVVAATVVERAGELGIEKLAWDGPEPAAFVEGAILAAYRYDAFKSEAADDGLRELVVREGAEASVAAEAQNAARDLINAPANVLTPTKLTARARELATELGLDCEVLGREQIRYAGMGAFAAVAQGSTEEPQLITLRYTPDDPVGPVLGLVGKAVTFDAGGISIKPALKMSAMKSDMAGGAAVLEATAAIARLQLPVRVVAVIGATENLLSGSSMKPGDIVRARSGTTIEIVNTDAEGRLVLCDCLTHAREQGAERLIDVATLTGGIVVALGSTFAGLFASDDAWAEDVRAAGARAGERSWRLPLDEEYAESIKGRWSDIVNAVEDRKAHATSGAEFLHRFVGDTPWAHLDIAGVGWDGGRAYAAKGGSGFATRTLVEVARGIARNADR
ncbi:MAG: leucyl aminopeptidase [Solirubrobacteraceae bacterium]|jgi:leucyl aminopeptidase|nr:leucyl aminopeptidase [Solirubrobacteraceae bacterium]